MEKEIEVEPSEDLAYWVGAVQTDGCISEYYPKGKKHSEIGIHFGVCSKSLPMVEKVRSFGYRVLKRYGKIYKLQKGDHWLYHIKVKQLLDIFKGLDIKFGDPPIPPKWVLEKSEFFGAYLAGVVDGDGCIVVKRPVYPQCVISITSGSFQTSLKDSITRILGCSTFQCITRRTTILDGSIIKGTGYYLQFYVSMKTAKFVSDFIIPHLQIAHKKDKLEKFIRTRYPLLN
ncbi:MAG: hypothetical protein HYW24_04230 [Candidatus Aenigmarchaeota archaeon]|nr:hypothetical protein [Candidatus Aenigmarchaeota archaeon]